VVILANTSTWEGTAKTEQDLIRRYREIALHPECDMAIEDIVNEAVVANELKDAIRLKLDEVPFGKEVRRKIEDEFQEILRLMSF
jgi:phage gp36-like protein